MPIFDQGYQHWRGPLSRHAWRWLTIARHGVRVQMQNRVLRLFLLFAWLPAIGLVLAMVLWGLVEQKSEGVLAFARNIFPEDVLREPRTFRATVWTLAYSFFFKTEMFFIMLSVVVAGPGLISQDLRFNALPLYFARPLNRLDYFLGKLGVIGALVLSVAVGPAVLAYVIGACFSLDLSVVKDTYSVLLASVAYGLVITLSVGSLMLAMSSLTRRSLYVGITWAGFWIITSLVGTILTAIHGESLRRELSEREITNWMQEHPPPKGTQMMAGPYPYPRVHVDPKTGKYRLAGLKPEQEAEGDRWYRAFQAESQELWVKAEQKQGPALRSNWRPLCSYVANLERIADQLLDTDGAWVTIGQSIERARKAAFTRGFGAGPRRRGSASEPPVDNERQLADQMVPQYPWQWSAGILAGLLGISTWILTRRVKSLDRLK
jgi:hypothetical protein